MQEHIPVAQDVIREDDPRDLIDDLIMHATSRDWDLPPLSGAAGVTPEWRRAFCVFRFADLLAQLETGDKLKALSVEDRAFLKGQVQQLVDDVAQYFAQPVDDGRHYQPELEPEYHDEVRR